MIPKSGYRFSKKMMLRQKAFSKSLKARDRRVRRALSRDHAQRCFDSVQHAIELVAAPHDQAGGGDHAVGALSARKLRIFLDAIDRDFRGAAEHGEHRAVLEEVDGVIPPLTGRHLAAVQTENSVELAPVERHAARGGEGRRARGGAPVKLARLSIAVAHAAPPFSVTCR